MKKSIFFLITLVFSETMILCQSVDPFLARDVAISYGQKNNLLTGSEDCSIIPLGLDNDTLLYVISFNEKGFIIVSGYRSAPPILGQCFNAPYDTTQMPPGLLYLFEKYKYGISKLKENNVVPSKETEEKWVHILKSDNLNKSYTIETWLVRTQWGQSNGYDYYATPLHPIGCTGVAMAQILHYWNCRVDGQINDYMWCEMDTINPDLNNALLIYDCCLACFTLPNGWAMPQYARDGLVDFFGISNSADLKWRIWHLNNWQDMLEDEIDLERPILYSAGSASSGGHSWVIDGYNQDGQFHCNWGWEGDYNDFYYLGDFDPGGWGPFNDLESAIFNIVPVQPSGVGTPQLSSQQFTYSPTGYSLNVQEVFGATSYDWVTQYGTISGSESNVTLYSDYSTNVQVRAYNNRCEIYSPYDYATITINYGPISGPTLLCSEGSQYSVLNVPDASSITWTNGSNINRISPQGSNPCIFSASGSGASWIGATITTSYGSSSVPNFPVYAGVPYINPATIQFECAEGSGYFCTNAFGNEFSFTFDHQYNYFDIKLTNLSETQTLTQFTIYDTEGIMDYFAPEGTYLFQVRGNNDCGTAINWSKTSVEYVDCGMGGLFSLDIYPNPTTEQATITIVTKEETNTVTNKVDEEWQLEVYTQGQLPKLNVPAIIDNKYVLNTSGWKTGVYFIRVYYKDEVLWGTLIVNK